MSKLKLNLLSIFEAIEKIKDFRNIVAHDYFGIDADEIWEIIQTKIKPLKKQIFELSENV